MNRRWPFWAFLLILQAISYGVSIPKYGLYEDDWVFAENTVLGTQEQYHRALGSFFWEGIEPRPMRFVERALRDISINELGLPAAYALILLIEAMSAWMIYLILARSISPFTAKIMAVFFLLAPLDTTLLWLATLHWRIAFLLVCCAIYLVETRFWLASIPLVLIAAGFNEGPMPLIVMAGILPSAVITRNRLRVRTAVATAMILGGYLIWRLVCLPLWCADSRVAFLLGTGTGEVGTRFFQNYIVALYVLLVSSVRFCIMAVRANPLLALLVLVVNSGLMWIGLRFDSFREAIRSALDRGRSDMKVLAGLAVVVWLSGYWTGIFSWTGFEPGGRTRMNYSGNLAFAALLTIVMIWIASISGRTVRLRATRGFACLFAMCTSILLIRAFHVQRDYKDAWFDQMQLIPALREAAAELSPGALIILKYEDTKGRSIGTFNDTWHHDAVARLYFPLNVRLILEKNLSGYKVCGKNEIKIYNIFEEIRVDPDRMVYWIWENGQLYQPGGVR